MGGVGAVGLVRHGLKAIGRSGERQPGAGW